MANSPMKSRKKAAKAPAAPAAPAAPVETPKKADGATKGNDVRFTVYMTPQMKKNLRLAQVDQDRPMNSIVVDAIDQYLKTAGLQSK